MNMREEPPNVLDESNLVGPGHSLLAEVACRLPTLRCASVGNGGGEVGRGGFRLTDGRGEGVYLTPAGDAQADVLLVVARQMLSEQAELARHSRLANGLGNKLMQVYEQTRAVLSVIGLGMTGGNVAQNMQAICEQAHAALPLGVARDRVQQHGRDDRGVARERDACGEDCQRGQPERADSCVDRGVPELNTDGDL